ncbi:MAG: hypothetical protein LBG90_00050 [Spirochaetaceae bacterium]|jgi:hypothetical protein|nr:hypothetical protein [Spirochaetaceae bacterium]
MKIKKILRPGKNLTQVQFEDGGIEKIPTPYAEAGQEYISVKMLKGADRYIRYEGEHILARLERGRLISIRNKDNICNATIARNRKTWGASRVWCHFLMEATKDMAFAAAVDYFERQGIPMQVSG